MLPDKVDAARLWLSWADAAAYTVSPTGIVVVPRAQDSPDSRRRNI